jgi:hypothetical protein
MLLGMKKPVKLVFIKLQGCAYTAAPSIAYGNDLGSTGVDGSTGCSALPLRFRLCCRSNLLCYLLFLMGLIIIYKSFTTKPQ